MTEMLKGIAASDGVAVAKAYLLVQPDLSFETVSVEDTNAEEARLDVALEASQNELSLIRQKAVDTLGEEAAAVFDAHLMVLADPEMIGQIKETIRTKEVNAESALKEVTDMFVTLFENMEDNPYMQERAADIRDVAKRVLAHLLGVELPNPATISEESIVIAHDLTPSDTAQLDANYVKAFVTNIGGRTSHSAIMARTLEIAAVLGTNDITERVKNGDIVAVNGITGQVIINPTEDQIAEFKAAGETYAKQKAEWALLKDAETVTADGKHFELAANIGTPKDVEGVNNNGAEINSNNDDTEKSVEEGRLTVGELQRAAINICTFILNAPVINRELVDTDVAKHYGAVSEDKAEYDVQKLVDSDKIMFDGRKTATMVVEDEAEYSIIVNISFAKSNLAQSTVNVNANGETMVVIQTNGTDGNWITQKLCKVKLDKGVYNIELEDVLAGIEVKYIQFKKIKKHKGK